MQEGYNNNTQLGPIRRDTMPSIGRQKVVVMRRLLRLRGKISPEEERCLGKMAWSPDEENLELALALIEEMRKRKSTGIQLDLGLDEPPNKRGNLF